MQKTTNNYTKRISKGERQIIEKVKKYWLQNAGSELTTANVFHMGLILLDNATEAKTLKNKSKKDPK